METTLVWYCQMCGETFSREDKASSWCPNCRRQMSLECELCLGDGVVPADEEDGEGHTAAGTESKTCLCQINDPNEESDD